MTPQSPIRRIGWIAALAFCTALYLVLHDLLFYLRQLPGNRWHVGVRAGFHAVNGDP